VSMQTMIRSHPQGDVTPGADPTRRPSIVPTRRRIDRRFSSLGFTITTTQPWVEVLLATDPSLFDPSRSASRTASNFYASRTHGGLTATASGRARYVAPASVVATLAATGSSLWFVAVGYPDSTGVGGVTSSETGASGAVVVEGSFRPGSAATTVRRALSYSRGLTFEPHDRLDGEDGADVAPSLPNSTGAVPLAGSSGVRMLSLEDRLDGEDGSDLPYAVVPAPVASAPPPPVDLRPEPAAPTAPAPVPAPAPGPAAGTAPAPDVAAAPPSANGTTPAAAEGMASIPYDDGWDSVDTASVPALSTIPALSDEYPDIDWGGPEYDDGYGAVPAHQSLEEAAPPAPAATVVTVPTPQRPVVLPGMDLPAEAQRRVIELTAADGGNAYSAVNADGPFRGRHGPGHKAYQRFHTGLSYGIAGFNQDSGTLGQLLRLMQEREPETFAAVFGDGAAALVATATAPGPSSEHVEGGRGPRVQPVAATDLWEEPWLSRFRAAGAVPDFRAAQNQLAAELYLAPMLPVAAGFGLTSERALCMVLDRAIALGEQGAKRWLADTVGPVKTPALRQSALAVLGFDSIESFQASVPGLLTDGEFGPVSHATLTAALRLLGPASPLPLPGTKELVEEMARRGQSEEGGARLLRIATATEFGDTPIGG